MFNDKFLNEARKSATIHPEINKWLVSAEKLKKAIETLKQILKSKKKETLQNTTKKVKVKPTKAETKDKKDDGNEPKKDREVGQ